MAKILYSPHAEAKLKERNIDKRAVESAARGPDRTSTGFYGRTIFEKGVDERHKIKVVCEKKGEVIWRRIHGSGSFL